MHDSRGILHGALRKARLPSSDAGADRSDIYRQRRQPGGTAHAAHAPLLFSGILSRNAVSEGFPQCAPDGGGRHYADIHEPYRKIWRLPLLSVVVRQRGRNRSDRDERPGGNSRGLHGVSAVRSFGSCISCEILEKEGARMAARESRQRLYLCGQGMLRRCRQWIPDSPTHSPAGRWSSTARQCPSAH